MDISQQIIHVLSNSPTDRVIVVAPGAPPVSRNSDGLRVIMDEILDPEDIEDTLRGIRKQAAEGASKPSNGISITKESIRESAEDTSSDSGHFSFGITDKGRFTVNFLTQRGSKSIIITRVPDSVPLPNELGISSDVIINTNQILAGNEPAVITVHGPSSISNAMFVYSLLAGINKTTKKIICTVEHTLSYLMKHDNSIVLQTEIGDDVETLQKGVSASLLFRPDILFIGGLRTQADLDSATSAIGESRIVIVSSAFLTDKWMMRHMCHPELHETQSVTTTKTLSLVVTPLEGGMITAKICEE